MTRTCFSSCSTIIILSILLIISLFMNYYDKFKENFYFEVSPQREKCLKEQVSLIPSNKRSCACCQKGTVGGYPPHYSEWLQPVENNDSWYRADNWSLSKKDVFSIPPTDYVNDPTNEFKIIKKKKSQKDLYNQK